MAQSPIRKLNRTICIGLGGTGKDVLMRIRRLIVDRYGSLDNLPIVSFVHIDTDRNAAQSSGLSTGDNYHGVDIRLTNAEKVIANMDPLQVTNFVEELEKKSTNNRRGPYDHIDLWFPQELLPDIKAIEEGAKGIRPVGRLAFFYNYMNIKETIETAENRTIGHEGKLLRNLGITVESGLNIFVVGSVCGGTGSGMFLDIAYSLRKHYGNDNTSIIGYLLISPKLYGNTPIMRANTYAALKELNYYSTPGNKFTACYNQQNQIIINESRPPFDYTYLISDEKIGSGESKILDQRQLYNVIAHKIALEFSGDLGASVKGMRDNFTKHLSEWDEYPLPNIQRYLTFGLAAIYFPRDAIMQIALNRISLKLVNFWLNGEGQSPEAEELLEQFLKKWHDDLNQKDGFKRKLEQSSQELNTTFSTSLNKWRNRIEKTINECKNQDDIVSMTQTLLRSCREEFRKTQSGDDDNSRGIWLTRLNENRPKIIKQFKELIDEYLKNLLTPSNFNFSIQSVRKFLEALITELNNNKSAVEEEINNFNGSKTMNDLDKTLDRTEEEMQIIMQKFALPLINNKNNEIKTIAKNVVRASQKMMKDNFDLQLHKEVRKIIEDVIKYVEDIIPKMGQFRANMDNLSRIYTDNEHNFQQMNFDEMIGEAIFAETDIENCYNLLLPEDNRRSQLITLTNNITESAIRSESIKGFTDIAISQEKIQAEINKSVDSVFANNANTSSVISSVIKRFMQIYPGSLAAERLERIKKEAEPLLRLNLKDSYFRNINSKRSQVIGFIDTNDAEVKDFKKILTTNLNILSHVIKPTQSEDEILIINEYAGFPLRLIKGLADMKKDYQDGQFLHNDNSEMFLDIIPHNTNVIEQIQEIFYPCLALELVRKNQEGKLQFKAYDSLRNQHYLFTLSPNWQKAIEELLEKEQLLISLQGILHQTEEKIRQNPQDWYSTYKSKILDFIRKIEQLAKNDPNFGLKGTVIGTYGNKEAQPKEGIIDWFIKRIESMINRENNPNISDGGMGVLSGNNNYVNNSGNNDLWDEDVIETEYLPAEIEPQNTSPKPINPANFMAELKELAMWRKEGLLNDEEFELAKKKLLES